jgi:hypothetical protein
MKAGCLRGYGMEVGTVDRASTPKMMILNILSLHFVAKPILRKVLKKEGQVEVDINVSSKALSLTPGLSCAFSMVAVAVTAIQPTSVQSHGAVASSRI